MTITYTDALAKAEAAAYHRLDDCDDSACPCWDDGSKDQRTCPHAQKALTAYGDLRAAYARVEMHLKNGDTECWQLTKWPQHEKGEPCERCDQFAAYYAAIAAIQSAEGVGE